MLFGLFWETIIKEEEDPISFMREKTRYHIFYESLRKKIPHRSSISGERKSTISDYLEKEESNIF